MSTTENTAETKTEIGSSPEQQNLGGMSAFCAWPLLLVLVGGMLGGILGGAAFGINMSIEKSNLSRPLKILLNLGVGTSAVAIWFAIAMAIQSL